MPMVPELPITMLACARLGVIHSQAYVSTLFDALRLEGAVENVISGRGRGSRPAHALHRGPVLHLLKPRGCKVSFIAKLRASQAEAAQAVDPWRLRLERVRGKIDFDGLERISTQNVMDVLEVPQRQRNAGAYRHLAKLMAELGWTAVRVRDLTRGGYKEQVR